MANINLTDTQARLAATAVRVLAQSIADETIQYVIASRSPENIGIMWQGSEDEVTKEARERFFELRNINLALLNLPAVTKDKSDETFWAYINDTISLRDCA